MIAWKEFLLIVESIENSAVARKMQTKSTAKVKNELDFDQQLALDSVIHESKKIAKGVKSVAAATATMSRSSLEAQSKSIEPPIEIKTAVVNNIELQRSSKSKKKVAKQVKAAATATLSSSSESMTAPIKMQMKTAVVKLTRIDTSGFDFHGPSGKFGGR